MSDEQVERRLAAIMAADVVGYSRLMEANEERTLGALTVPRKRASWPSDLPGNKGQCSAGTHSTRTMKSFFS